MSKRNRLRRALRRRLRRDHLRGDYSVPTTRTRLEAQVLKETRKEALTILNKAPSFADWMMKQGGPLEMLRNVAEKMSFSQAGQIFDGPYIHDVNGMLCNCTDATHPGAPMLHVDGPFWLSTCASCGELFRPKNDEDEIDDTSVCGECAEKGL